MFSQEEHQTNILAVRKPQKTRIFAGIKVKYVARKHHHMNNAIIPKPLVKQGQEFSCAEMNMKSKFYAMQMER